MQFMISCLECRMERDSLESPPLRFVELTEECVVAFTCDAGHENVFTLQEQKFEILFEMGAMALLDGYYREAVASIAVALERFFEFYIRVICVGQGIDREQLKAAWKPVNNASERQLGAFMFLFLLETTAPFQLDESKVAFRNKVVHRGYLPTREEATAYAEWAFGLIRDLGTGLKKAHGDAADRVIAIEIGERSERHRSAGKQVGTSYHSTILGWADGAWSEKKFHPAMKNLAGRRHLMWAPPEAGNDTSPPQSGSDSLRR